MEIRLRPQPPTQEDVEAYEKRLESYLREYRDYLGEKSRFAVEAPRVRPLTFVLRNNGFAPADEIDIRLHFPDELIPADIPLRYPTPSNPPQKPQLQSPFPGLRGLDLRSLNRLVDVSPISPIRRHIEHHPPPKSTGPHIRKTNSYEVRYTKSKLKHHNKWLMQKLYIFFETPKKLPTAFEVNYRITAANVPALIEDTLVVQLDRR